jgi:hypothetical protein
MGLKQTVRVTALKICIDVKTKPKINFSSVRFEFFTAVAIKNAVFWNITPCGSSNNRRFRGTYFFAA